MKNPEVSVIPASINGDLFDQVEVFLEKNRNIFLVLCILVTTLLCYLLFDARMSFATDDSEYVLMANNFVHYGGYPTYHGTMYPVFLGLLMKIFGLNVPVFKLFSGLFIIASVFFFYKAFKGKVPYIVLFTTVIYLSVNSDRKSVV